MRYGKRIFYACIHDGKNFIDFNGDDALCDEDLGKMLDYLTKGRMKRKEKQRIVNNAST